MFQGFEIHSRDEIDELKRHTQHVYVIMPDEEIELTARTYDPAITSTKTELLHKKNYDKPVQVDREIKRARPEHEKFTQLFRDLESQIRKEGNIPYEFFERPVKNLVSSMTSNPDAYIWLTRLRQFDSFLYKDSLTAATWATAMGRKLGIAEQQLQMLAVACLLMDIGKMCLPPELLRKAQRLDNDEWAQMKSHIDLGIGLLEKSGDYPNEVIETIRTHHERHNGSGYPLGLEGSQIPLFGQIAGIVDQYVAVTSPRPYARTISPSRAEEILYNQRGKQFDEMLVEYFIQTLSTYPTGSLVELSSGEIGIVKAQKPGHNLRPDVILLLDTNKAPYGTYPLVNLDNYIAHGQPVSIRRTLADGEYGIAVETLSL